MNGNVLGFHVGFWVTLTHCIKLKMWVFNQSIFYFSVYLWKQRPAPICCCVNYRTIKTCLNYPSKLRAVFSHLQNKGGVNFRKIMTTNHTKVHPQKRIFLKTFVLKLFPLLQHSTVRQLHLICASDLFMQSVPIQVPLLYSNRETEISSFFIW